MNRAIQHLAGVWGLVATAMMLCSMSLAARAADLPPSSVVRLQPEEVSAAVQVEPKDVVRAVKWTDASGINLVVLSQSSTPHPKTGEADKQLRAQHFRQSASGQWVPGWKLMDQVQACDQDSTCAFVKNALWLSDVDNDGIAEISFAYRVDCHDGASPITQKLMVFHRDVKHAIRGRTVYTDKEGHQTASDQFVTDDAFKRAPPEVLQLAVQMWRRTQDHRFTLWTPAGKAEFLPPSVVKRLIQQAPD